ncbi:uncharacterized protein MONBRDRAFT_27300 [Monosiga brevicollis MX1]|uniref:Uncharacterized protein n=1 Tax=Monosiga brevicollis TaxID=81824 RepID=A9V4W5_MONBE|nr:uncharacterized protein MONBRDRAFT_27300 [Monosiga brevicollis MX1]EDQ87440.1 predicted protein [Monosiga brevicollis MX1]|eukprot:XP_001747700.1 hypothetical protein [Monosiga brevicollis MX1]
MAPEARQHPRHPVEKRPLKYQALDVTLDEEEDVERQPAPRPGIGPVHHVHSAAPQATMAGTTTLSTGPTVEKHQTPRDEHQMRASTRARHQRPAILTTARVMDKLDSNRQASQHAPRAELRSRLPAHQIRRQASKALNVAPEARVFGRLHPVDNKTPSNATSFASSQTSTAGRSKSLRGVKSRHRHHPDDDAIARLYDPSLLPNRLELDEDPLPTQGSLLDLHIDPVARVMDMRRQRPSVLLHDLTNKHETNANLQSLWIVGGRPSLRELFNSFLGHRPSHHLVCSHYTHIIEARLPSILHSLTTDAIGALRGPVIAKP